MLFQFIICLAWVAIPFSTAHPADGPLVDFGSLDLSSTPETCKSTCSGVSEQLSSTCTSDLKCLCTDKVGAALSPCFSCLAGVANTTQATTAAHLVLSQWASTCNAANMPVGTPSLSAQAGGPSSATAANNSGTNTTSKSKDSTANNTTASHTSSASPSASTSAKPNHGDGPLHQNSGLMAVVGAFFAALFV